ncbi:MAG TPA: hypothetical protein VKU87_08580 [Thermomicrobiaceae bacterium]|nr:hypothetical protein [Thermomicrobiaceae bacterium]
MVFHRRERIALLALEGFGAVSAAAGAIGLLGGGIKFPSDWLTGGPFNSYVGPGLILGLLVGGSQAAAFTGVLRRSAWAATASALAGLTMAGWIGGEILLVGTKGGLMATLQIIYLLNGLLELAVIGQRRQTNQPAT